MMLFLKIIVQIFSMLTTWVIARLDYTWYDKGTLEFKKGRLALFITLSILLFLSIAVIILDDREKKGEIEQGNSKITELTTKLKDVTNELTGGDSFCYFVHQTHMYMSSNEPRSYNDVELSLMPDFSDT